MIKTILAAIGFGWSKWETIEKDKSVMRQDYNPIIGYKSEPYHVTVDVQMRTNSMTGEVKYKYRQK